MEKLFQNIANKTSHLVGSAWVFILALCIVIVWFISGPIFHFSDTWQLVINTGTTIVTFLIVFLIQNTQNREAKAIHIQLSELIRSIKGARNELIDIENLSGNEIEEIHKQFRRLQKLHTKACQKNKNCPFKT